MGYDVSEDDINAYIAAKKDAMSNEDLDQVSGGGYATEQTVYEVSTTATTTEVGTELETYAAAVIVAT